MIQTAVASGELILLDFASKLPLSTAKNDPLMRDDEEEVQPWTVRARTMAASKIESDLAASNEPKKRAIAAEIAKMFAADGTRSKQGKTIDTDYIKRHALQKWGDMVLEERRKLAA